MLLRECLALRKRVLCTHVVIPSEGIATGMASFVLASLREIDHADARAVIIGLWSVVMLSRGLVVLLVPTTDQLAELKPKGRNIL
jgi:hypothetical protein